jgi:hypothetical protein
MRVGSAEEAGHWEVPCRPHQHFEKGDVPGIAANEGSGWLD